MKKLTLIPEAKAVWHRLWSVRFAIASAVVAGAGALQTVLPLWQPIVPPLWFAVASSLLGVCSAMARVVKQNLPSDDQPQG